MNGPALYLGIDPGASGGIAAIDSHGHVLSVSKMPDTERDLVAHLETLAESTRDERLTMRVRAVLELVWSSPQMGVASAFKFGANVGAIRTALVAAGIPFDTATPQRWQKALGCQVGKSRASGAAGGDKNITKRRAQELFPGTTVTHAVADSLLLAEYCRRCDLQPAQGEAL